MLRYITRHGQVDTTGGDCRYPNGDIMLTELGRKQAHLLGERLKREKFDGRIICSPFVRTLCSPADNTFCSYRRPSV